MDSINKLWKKSGKKVPFKQFVTDYNAQKELGLQDPPPPADMVVEVDYMQPQYNEVTGEVEQTPVIREYIMVDIRPGISGKDILIFGISGFLVGAFVGLLITRE